MIADCLESSCQSKCTNCCKIKCDPNQESIGNDNNNNSNESHQNGNNGLIKETEESQVTIVRIPGVRLVNHYLESMERDYLYHLGLVKEGDTLQKKFGDVRFICTGGSADRMLLYAKMMKEELGITDPLVDIAAAAHRYSMYKVGPVIFVNHGMGIPSLSILLHELFKLFAYAKCKDVIMFRVGTCGGLGKPPGTVIVSKGVVDDLCRPVYELKKLGKIVTLETVVDQELADRLIAFATKKHSTIPVEAGITMTTSDFYEGQARCDGAFCEFTKEEALSYLQSLKDKGVTNIEMEACAFVAMCHKARVKCGVANVILVDRLATDQVVIDPDTYQQMQLRPYTIVAGYISSLVKR